ncbi:hypothetical protein K469DRAFT_78041 [Zopfia rhizophila CBS 207.26]|uniref:BZIP domain-containing protein n=1 Tax=Zopfia rhizophila CBS 207.26 TaxID=1314779 RepID=A0A6A6D732_9PEZI|nr:hypothetical protein K469DRAFT_78041 [Zopfia rhizophila CBS 207.26]
MNGTRGNQKVSPPPTVLSTGPDDRCRIEPILYAGSADWPVTGSSRVYGPPGGPSFLGAPAYTAIPRKSNAPPALPPVSHLLNIAPILPGADPFHTREKRVMVPSLQSSSDRSETEYSNPSQIGRTFQATSSASRRTRGRNLPGPRIMKSPAVSSGESRCKFVTVNSRHGPVNVAADVVIASGEAERKRSLNRKASKRFRDRRKERESELASKIARLERELREAKEQRDYWACRALHQTPDGRHHFPGPESLCASGAVYGGSE